MYKFIILLALLLSFDSLAGKPISNCSVIAHKNALDFEIDAFKMELSYYNSNESFIPLSIANRRKHEQLCYIAASCFDSEPNKSIEFSSCLEGWKNEIQD